MNPSALEEMLKLFEEKLFVAPIPEEPAEVDDDEDDDNDADIVEKLRHATPCVRCNSVCEDAAKEIEALRMKSSDASSAADDGVLETLNEAIVSMDPCGREDCLCPSVAFLIRIRDELWRLRRAEHEARRLSMTAKQVWRKERGDSHLLRAAHAFDRTQP